MLKKYKNGFFEILKKKELNFEIFNSEEYSKDDLQRFLITIQNTSLRFEVTQLKDNFHNFYCIFTEFKPVLADHGRCPTEGWTTIDAIYSWFEYWLDNDVKEYFNEITLPDLWEQINQQKLIVGKTALDNYELSPFTEEEKQALRISINHFKVLVAEMFKPSRAQMHFIDERLNYLAEALDRLNRFDWKGLLLSIVIGISINLCVDTEKGKILFDFVKQAFSNILKLLK